MLIDISGFCAQEGNVNRSLEQSSDEMHSKILYEKNNAVLDRYGDALINSVKDELTVAIIQDQVIKFGGVVASHTTIDPKTVGQITGKTAAYISIVPVVINPWKNAYQDTFEHPERDNVEALARYFIDFSGYTVNTIIGIGCVPLGITTTVAYEANREQIQDAILYNPVSDKAGGIVYNALGGTRVGSWLGL